MDSAQWWEKQGAKQQQIKKSYNDAGIKIIVSVFGGGADEMKITSLVNDPAGLANKIGDWVKANNLDGVDVDYEDFNALNGGTGVPWIVTFQKALRSALPSPQYVISHTRTFIMLVGLFKGGNGAYIDVHKQVGDGIDWYNIQFYNAGPDEYTTCDSLLNKSSSQYPNTSLFEIVGAGIPQNKVVLGKPATTKDAQQGNMDADVLAGCLETAKGKGWSGGVMAWAYPNADASWVSTVRSKSWPVS
ncbi:glycoside hydrolase [Dendrothele bispora CBS 962.96]|uniref:Glycoside hydrolase n=1 Tax=Dendrothele bispora (strain CBS 962.96) TaxID=1314807 RepID=A0A4V4HBV2_DENBC|nr:glycoside hydrolase [Dendrothele bispora CBS 962.96]